MRRSTILTVTTMAALLATAALAQVGSPTTAQKQIASDPASRIATLSLTARTEIPATNLTVPSRAPRLLPNEKLGAATCDGLTVAIGAPGSLVFEDGFESGNAGRWNPNQGSFFSVRGALDLEFAASLPGLSGEPLFRLELTSPRGHHFQTLEAPIVIASSENQFGAIPQARTVSGYPHPVPVRFAAPQAGGELAASMIWPLAGTHVVSHGLYGEWTASASLVDPSSPSGESSVVCPAAHFTIQP